MARAFLRLSQEEFARGVGLDKNTLNRAEDGFISAKTAQKIIAYINVNGLMFTESEGIKRKPVQPLLLGTQGILDFYEDVYNTVKRLGGDLFLYNAPDSEFLKWTDNMHFTQMHIDRMSKLNNYKFRILIEEGDVSTISSEYAEYRWLPKVQQVPTPMIYGYCNKVALLNLKTNPTIQIIENREIVSSFREGFDVLWEKSLEITH